VKRKTEEAVLMTARIMVSLLEGMLLMDGQQVLTLEEDDSCFLFNIT
jgi:hypothetical protein